MRAAVGKSATESSVYFDGRMCVAQTWFFHGVLFALIKYFSTWLNFWYDRIIARDGKNGKPDFDYFHA